MLVSQKKTLKVGKLVNTDHVNSVIRNYKQERWVHNSKRLGKEDSLSAWFSVEELEEFLEEAKAHGGDGIRLYFGAYDKSYEEQPLYAGRQTIVLVATRQKETEHGEVNKDIYIQAEKGNTILAYNSAQLCPPLCSNSDDFGGIGITIVDKGNAGLAIA